MPSPVASSSACLAEPAIEQDAEVGPPAAAWRAALRHSFLKWGMCSRVMPAASAIASSWARWSNAIASTCGQARVRVVDQWICSSLRILAQRLLRRAVREEVLQLGPARHRRRAAVARHRERAAGIGVLAAVLDRLIAQVAAQKAAHEGIARAQDVEHLDREARALDALLDVAGNGAVEHGAAHRPALDHDQRFRRERPDPAACAERIGGAARDVDLFLGADDHVAARQDGLQVGRDALVGDEALLAEAMAGQAPQHRPVVDVEDHPAAVLSREAHRLLAHGIEVGPGEMGARDHDRARRGDVRLVDVVFGQRRIRAVVAVEDQGKRVLVADAEDDQRGQPRRIGLDAADVDPLGARPAP